MSQDTILRDHGAGKIVGRSGARKRMRWAISPSFYSGLGEFRCHHGLGYQLNIDLSQRNSSVRNYQNASIIVIKLQLSSKSFQDLLLLFTDWSRSAYFVYLSNLPQVFTNRRHTFLHMPFEVGFIGKGFIMDNSFTIWSWTPKITTSVRSTFTNIIYKLLVLLLQERQKMYLHWQYSWVFYIFYNYIDKRVKGHMLLWI